MSVFRKHSRGGDMDFKNTPVYISGSSAGGHDFIPAFKGSGRLGSLEADTPVDGSKVFGNPMFDDMDAAKEKMTLGANPFAKFSRSPSQRAGERQNDGSPWKTKQAFTDAAEFNDEPDMAVVSSLTKNKRPVEKTPREISVGQWERELKQMVETKLRTQAMFRPAPSDGTVHCYVKRVKNFFGTHCSFQMHLENGDVFLLAARRRKKSKVSSYVISQNLDDLKRDTDNCLAKLKGNFSGTEYMLWGKSDDPEVKKGYAKERVIVTFKQNPVIKAPLEGGPRSMTICMPVPESKWEPNSDKGEGLEQCLGLAIKHELTPHLDRKLCMLSTKPPEYDENVKGYTLDFKGRVKEASVKNFQLVHWDHSRDTKGSHVALQFGKVEDDRYILDFSYPLNIETAFAIALSSIDTKLCYSY